MLQRAPQGDTAPECSSSNTQAYLPGIPPIKEENRSQAWRKQAHSQKWIPNRTVAHLHSLALWSSHPSYEVTIPILQMRNQGLAMKRNQEGAESSSWAKSDGFQSPCTALHFPNAFIRTQCIPKVTVMAGVMLMLPMGLRCCFSSKETKWATLVSDSHLVPKDLCVLLLGFCWSSKGHWISLII